MGVLTHEADFSSRVAPARLFKALALDNVNLVPKVSTDVKSVEILEGDGGVGTIKKLNFKQAGSNFNYAVIKTEAIDVDNLEYIYSLIEGEGLTDKLEKITYVMKFVESPGGGSVIKTISKYHTKGEHHGITHEDNIKERKDKSIQVFNILDKYLLENPHAYI